MPRFLVVLTVLAFACKTAPPAQPHEPEPPASPFAALAAELATPAQPVWPTIPADLAEDLKRSATASGDARARLTGWDFDVSTLSPPQIGAKLRAALEGIYLAEPAAYNATPTADGIVAAGLLHHLYNALDTAAYRDWMKTAPNIGLDRKLLEILAEVAPAQRKHLAAKVLTAGQPAEPVDSVLRSLAERARTDGNFARSRELFAKLVERRGAAATLEDWLDLAAADGRVDDRAGAVAALDQAKSKPLPDRASQAKLRDARKDLASLDRYLALKNNPAVEGRIEQLDLLRSLGRAKDAEALLADLKRIAPLDARVRVRAAAMTFEGMAAGGNMLDAAGYVAQELGDPALTNKDADYWQMLIGAQGAHAMGEALPLLFQDRVAGGKKMVEILKTIRAMAENLEATRPGRAAALELVLDRAIPIVEKSLAQDVAIADVLKGGLDAALALRTKYPEATDIDRLVFTFATFSTDRQRALDVVMQRPGTAPDDDIELYLARARTAVTLAIVIATPQAIDAARTAATDIAPSWNPQFEAHREALLGDCDALAASVTNSDSLWTSAEKHYQAAGALHRDVHARVANNLGWIELHRGNVEQADALFRESGDDERSDRRWLAFLNALATPLRANERLAGLRSLILANANDGKSPTTLLIWLAATTTDPKEAGDAAQKALDDLADPFSKIKPVNGARGFETEGVFQVGLGLASRKFADLNTNAYASLWLMPPLPLDEKQLAAKLPKPAKKTKK